MVLYARDIVEKDFLSIAAESTVIQGAGLMKSSRHGFAVIGSPENPQGIVTEWDIVCKVVAEGKDPHSVTMGEIMSKELLSIEAGTGIAAVSQLMTERGVRRLLVRDGPKIIGFITGKTMLARMNEYVDKVSSQISRLQAPWM
jgi:CBS domain-containing protein